MSNSAVEKVEPLPFFVMVTEKCERGQDALHTIKHVGANKSQQDKSESQPQDKSAQINVEVTAESDNIYKKKIAWERLELCCYTATSHTLFSSQWLL